MARPLIIIFRADGTAGALYADELVPFFQALGHVTVQRASHVEFDNQRGGWTVELEPGVLGAALTGSMLAMAEDGRLWASLLKSRAHVFPTRQEALQAEVVYLQGQLG